MSLLFDLEEDKFFVSYAVRWLGESWLPTRVMYCEDWYAASVLLSCLMTAYLDGDGVAPSTEAS